MVQLVRILTNRDENKLTSKTPLSGRRYIVSKLAPVSTECPRSHSKRCDDFGKEITSQVSNMLRTQQFDEDAPE